MSKFKHIRSLLDVVFHCKVFFYKNSLVSKQFVGGYDLPYRYRRLSCKHIALRMFSRRSKTLTALPFQMKYVLGIQAIKYLCTALSLREVWVIYKRWGQIFVTSTINHSLYQWHVLISSEIYDENWCCRRLLVSTNRDWLNCESEEEEADIARVTK
jgi:hypothetical protein